IAQEVEIGRNEVRIRMREYLEHEFLVDTCHTNKWQSNYYASKNSNIYYDESTFKGEEGVHRGAPYGYGVKDTPTELENKISSTIKMRNETEQENIFLTAEDNFYDEQEIIVTSTDYMNEESQHLEFEIKITDGFDPWKSWQISLFHVQYQWDCNDGSVSEKQYAPIWYSDWYSLDSIKISDLSFEIAKSGKYVIRFSADPYYINPVTAKITVTKPITAPDNIYACGAHMGDYIICSNIGSHLPDEWAFGIDCSGYVAYGYDLPNISDKNTYWFAREFEEIEPDAVDMADYLVKEDCHIVMIDSIYGDNRDYIDIFESAGELDENIKPDGIVLQENKNINIYLNNGYELRTPFYDYWPPEIEKIYLTLEEDITESELDSKWTSWVNSDNEPIRPPKKFDVIVKASDTDPFVDTSIKTEVKEITYNIYKDNNLILSGVGFLSNNKDDNYGSISNPDSLSLIYASGTDTNECDFQYIITNENASKSDSIGTLDLTNLANDTEIRIDVIAYDWQENPDFASFIFHVYNSPPLCNDAESPYINSVYFVQENDTSETKVNPSYGPISSLPILPKDKYDIIVNACDESPGSNWEYQNSEVKQIYYEYSYDSDHDSLNGFTATQFYNYDHLDENKRDFIYAENTDRENNKYHYIVTNRSSTTSDSGTFDCTEFRDSTMIEIRAWVEDFNGNSSYTDKQKYWIGIEPEDTTQALGTDNIQNIPDSFVLFNNYPNPFNSQTVIRYQMAEDAHVLIIIFNIRGQRIKTLVNCHQSAGYYSYRWDGRDDREQKIESGVYFCLMKCNNYNETKKLLYLR
ncbi:MAG: T9SS type A sorting domain-containing protein, partial [Candidatus Lokiarchaeota archaeon]|nr:T9SS type A sorting domain-containing protein [Candidatus Lokiarchaeota archaeon]